MAIQPIDLQTLYAQMAKVGKQQGAEQQLASMVKEEQQQQNKIDAQKKLSSVQVVDSDSNKKLRIRTASLPKKKIREEKMVKIKNLPALMKS